MNGFARSDRSFFRSTQSTQVNYQDEAIFRLFDYQTLSFANHDFTVRYIITLQSGSDLVFWVKGKKSPSSAQIPFSDWHTSTPNLLNSPAVDQSTSLSQLQADRYSVLSQLAKTFKFEIIPKMEKITEKITQHENARFDGIHILLYDIKDSFEVDQAFFGGYLDPVDQESAPNGPLNLIHMDIYPMTPGGRTSPAQVNQKDFYHTMTHELFHLHHYRRTKFLNNSWSAIHNWLKEGLAQLAVYEFLKESTFYQSSEKLLDISKEYVSQVSSYFELQSPISIFDNYFENYGMNYIWLPFLLDNPNLESRVKLFNDLVDQTNCAIEDPRLCIDAFSKTLADHNLDLKEELAKFSIAQLYNHQGLKLTSISSSSHSSLDSLKITSGLSLSDIDSYAFAQSSNYQINYQNIHNDSTQYQSLKLSSDTTFILIKYPSKSIIDSCVASNDFDSCFLSLGKDLLVSESKSIVLSFIPNETCILIYLFVNHPFGDRVKHFLNASILSSHQFENGISFKSRPKMSILSNSLRIEFEIHNSSIETIIPKIKLSSGYFTKIVNLSIKNDNFNLSKLDDNKYSYTLYLDNEVISLEGLKIDISLVDANVSQIGEQFSHQFLSSYPLQTETYAHQLYSGWNSMSIYPDVKKQSYSDYIALHLKDVNVEDCIYTYVNFSFHSVLSGLSQCSSPTSTMSTAMFDAGAGLLIKSSQDQVLALSRFKLARTKIDLKQGWNFGSLAFHDKSKEYNLSGQVAISYSYNPRTMVWDSIYNVGENRPMIDGLSLDQLSAFRAYFIYSLQKHQFYSY
ncbi:hypothetical protein MJH12_00815 [bacterium]|nr:hypothetical protein [bacterium]